MVLPNIASKRAFNLISFRSGCALKTDTTVFEEGIKTASSEGEGKRHVFAEGILGEVGRGVCSLMVRGDRYRDGNRMR